MVRSIPLSRGAFLGAMRGVLHSCCLVPLIPLLSSVEFLGEMSDVLHSRAPLPLIPPAPFSHKGRRGRLGVLMAETGDGTQGLPRAQGGLQPARTTRSAGREHGLARIRRISTEDKKHPALKGSVPGSDARCAAFLRLVPLIPLLSSVEFLGEMSDVLHSRAPLPLIPPAPFFHKGRRGRLGVLMAETGDGTQGLPRAQGGLQPA
jgi:hypothetical protein